MKMRITIDVERKDGPLTDEDLTRAVEACAHVVEVDDADLTPLMDASLGNELTWGYCVHEVTP